jgi:hypothetical protein
MVPEGSHHLTNAAKVSQFQPRKLKLKMLLWGRPSQATRREVALALHHFQLRANNQPRLGRLLHIVRGEAGSDFF